MSGAPGSSSPRSGRQIVNHALAHRAQTVLIEKAGPGLQLVQELASPGQRNPAVRAESAPGPGRRCRAVGARTAYGLLEKPG